MDKIATNIKLTDMTPAWGLVCITNADHSGIARAHCISRAELQEFESSGLLPNCVEQTEWDAGRVIIAARPCLPGQGVVQSDGSMVIHYGIMDDGRVVDVSIMRIYPSEFQIVDDVVFLLPSIAKQVDLEHESWL